MSKIRQLGNLVESGRKNPNRGRLYDTRGIAPTVYNFAIGGGHGIFVLETKECEMFFKERKTKLRKCKNLEEMAENGEIPLERSIWIDAYNKIVGDIAGTIKARIDQNNLYFITEINEYISSDKNPE